MALENAGWDNREIRQSLIEFCEESFRRFPREDQLLTENRRRALGGALRSEPGFVFIPGRWFGHWRELGREGM